MEFPARPQIGLHRVRRNTFGVPEQDSGELQTAQFKSENSILPMPCKALNLSDYVEPIIHKKLAVRRPSVLDTPPVSPIHGKPAIRVQSAKSPMFPLKHVGNLYNAANSMAPKQQDSNNAHKISTAPISRQMQDIAKILDFDALYYNPEYIVAHIANKLRLKKIDNTTRSSILLAIKSMAALPEPKF